MSDTMQNAIEYHKEQQAHGKCNSSARNSMMKSGTNFLNTLYIGCRFEMLAIGTCITRRSSRAISSHSCLYHPTIMFTEHVQLLMDIYSTCPSGELKTLFYALGIYHPYRDHLISVLKTNKLRQHVALSFPELSRLVSKTVAPG